MASGSGSRAVLVALAGFAGLVGLAGLGGCRVTEQRFTTQPAMPRLIAPISMSTVTRQAPTLRWVLGPGDGAPVVELCKDRGCGTPIAIELDVATDGHSAVPRGDLPPGWVYWRVRVELGDEIAISPTWQFRVGRPHSEAPVAVDTASGAMLDVNGDGFADFLVGAPVGGATMDGTAHVYLGSSEPSADGWNGDGAARRIDLANPTGVRAFYGQALGSAGDINGDGYGDFLIGAPFNGGQSGTVPGYAYLYLGGPDPTAADWNDPASEHRIALSSPDGGAATFGGLVAGIGDVNGDGYGDFLAAASAYGVLQPLHVYLGSAAPLATAWNGTTASDRIDLRSPDVNTTFATIAAAGDVDGDGLADFAAATEEPGGGVGTVHLYLGTARPSEVSWNGDAARRRIDLASPDGPSGRFISVAGAGDVNGDGHGDLVISGNSGGFGTPSSGLAYVYFGMSAPTAAAWNGASPARRIDLKAPEGGLSLYSNTALTACDVNGDQFDDFPVGATSAHANAGGVYLYVGGVAPSEFGWNAPQIGRRIDLVGPDPPNSLFGRLR